MSAVKEKRGFVQCGHFLTWRREVLQVRMSALFSAKKTSDFSKFMVCPNGQGGKGLNQCGQGARGGQFFAILCVRLLCTAPYLTVGVAVRCASAMRWIGASGVARISKWGWGLAGSGGRKPQLLEAIGGLGASQPEARVSGNGVPTLGYFCKFLIKITYFGQNRYFKAITHQLKTFKISLNVLNSINEVQVLYYLFKCN